jgi:peptidoglycan hydrolase-like protein with peptidoglycan-binding domain
MSDEQILRHGDSGTWVSHLQQLLLRTGYDPGPVDGEFGDETEAAVLAYQRGLRLAVDGVVGPDTWFALYRPAMARRPGGGYPVIAAPGGQGELAA